MEAEKTTTVAVPDELRTLTLYEVAQVLNLGYDTVRDRAVMGRLPGALRVGKWWRVRYVVFRRWLDKGCPESRQL